MKTKAFIWSFALAAMLVSPSVMAMEKDQQCMPMQHSGDADADFIKNMIPHHQMAVDMAEMELKNGKDAESRAMAQKILDAQRKEIADMEAWLKNHK
jgi:uncharacterized protein (DUF305 family)